MTQTPAHAGASYTFNDDLLTPVTVTKGAHSTPVWIQKRWQDGEFATYIQNNGCGHCCVAMALRLSGIADVTPYDEYLHCRALWGAPDEAAGQYHFLSVAGALKSLRSYGVKAEAYGFLPGEREAAVAHMLEELARGRLVLFDSLPLREDNPFSSGAHYVLFVGLTEDGRVIVANSSVKARTDTLGIQTVNTEEITAALSDEGCEPLAHDLTWGVLCDYRQKLGYIVIG